LLTGMAACCCSRLLHLYRQREKSIQQEHASRSPRIWRNDWYVEYSGHCTTGKPPRPPVLDRHDKKMARCGRPFSLRLRLLSVDLFNQVVLCSHLLDLVKLGLDKIYMSFLFLEN
jgi:hypothetical protein